MSPAGGGSSPYDDPRFRGVALVDYSRPGFAVVWAEGEPAPRGEVRVAIRATPLGVALEPSHAALGAGGRLTLRNEARSAQAVSLPEIGLVRRLAPGEEFGVTLAGAGSHAIHLLAGDRPAEAVVFAAPGAWAIADAQGRFALSDLPPGTVRLHTWHPRFPPTERELRLSPDRALRVELEIGVDVPREGAARAH